MSKITLKAYDAEGKHLARGDTSVKEEVEVVKKLEYVMKRAGKKVAKIKVESEKLSRFFDVREGKVLVPDGYGTKEDAADPLFIPPFLRREVTPESRAKVDKIVDAVLRPGTRKYVVRKPGETREDGTPEPKPKGYAKSQIETVGEYKGHRAGSRKAEIRRIFDEHGAEAAKKKAEQLSLKPSTISSWFSEFRRSDKRKKAG